ncbi:MAG: hypothetical protein IRY99_09960, partial [Isosphaeraceae bacterium]|nr:hypothetical protein [Isosphaeraceae bacterium]
MPDRSSIPRVPPPGTEPNAALDPTAADAPAPEPAPPERSGRLRLRWKWETRVGLAAVLSFLTVVAVAIHKKGWISSKGAASRAEEVAAPQA